MTKGSVWKRDERATSHVNGVANRLETECGPASLIFRARGTATACSYEGEVGTAAKISEARNKSDWSG